ncbi:hypothetical protein AB3K78_08100 [Leucobacter sp. HNU]|uniref:hypothetical protein n=1 Tax=Leucobacter sp. HNU TaxID=3236805 RepID=UPI003A80C7C5
MWSGSAEGQQLAFVDARAGRVTAVGAGSSSPALASCGGELVEAGEYGVRAVTRASRELDGFGILDDVLGLACDAEHVYGLGEISRDANSSQTVRVWDRATGERREIRVRYPEHVLDSSVGTPFVRDGRLYWAADWRLWSIRLPSGEAAAPAPVAEATVAADLGGFIGDYDPVVGGDDLVLARAGGRVYGVASKEEFVNPKRGAVHDRLDGLAIFGADVRTGERRIVLEIHDIDFPRRDLSVTSIAVDPKWADRAAAR